ncbi:MAG: hypothetical protein ACMUFK_02125, partial [Thermoplasmatota archaeon]
MSLKKGFASFSRITSFSVLMALLMISPIYGTSFGNGEPEPLMDEPEEDSGPFFGTLNLAEGVEQYISGSGEGDNLGYSFEKAAPEGTHRFCSHVCCRAGLIC